MSFRDRPRIKRFSGTLQTAAEACARVGQEYLDMARLQKGLPERAWACSVRMRPMTVEQGDRFVTALSEQAGVTTTRLPEGTNPERFSYMEATILKQPDAAGAEAFMATRMRRALHEADIVLESYDVAVRPEGEAVPGMPKAPDEVTLLQVGGSDGPEVAFYSREKAHELMHEAEGKDLSWTMTTYPLYGPPQEARIEELRDFIAAAS